MTQPSGRGVREKVRRRIAQIRQDQAGMTAQDLKILKAKAAKLLQDIYEKDISK